MTNHFVQEQAWPDRCTSIKLIFLKNKNADDSPKSSAFFYFLRTVEAQKVFDTRLKFKIRRRRGFTTSETDFKLKNEVDDAFSASTS